MLEIGQASFTITSRTLLVVFVLIVDATLGSVRLKVLVPWRMLPL